MKNTIQTNGNFPRPGRFSLYIGAVVVFCFFNWVALNAEGPTRKNNPINSKLVIAMAEEDEPAIKLQDWMLDFRDGYLAAAEEPEIKVEPWMLSFGQVYMAGPVEQEIIYEPWMINFEQRCLVVEEEQDHAIEYWMVSTCTWDCVRLMSRR